MRNMFMNGDKIKGAALKARSAILGTCSFPVVTSMLFSARGQLLAPFYSSCIHRSVPSMHPAHLRPVGRAPLRARPSKSYC